MEWRNTDRHAQRQSHLHSIWCEPCATITTTTARPCFVLYFQSVLFFFFSSSTVLCALWSVCCLCLCPFFGALLWKRLLFCMSTYRNWMVVWFLFFFLSGQQKNDNRLTWIRVLVTNYSLQTQRMRQNVIETCGFCLKTSIEKHATNCSEIEWVHSAFSVIIATIRACRVHITMTNIYNATNRIELRFCVFFFYAFVSTLFLRQWFKSYKYYASMHHITNEMPSNLLEMLEKYAAKM